MAGKKKTMLGGLRPQDFRALGIGLELSGVIGGMTYGGYWLDQKLGTEPWLLLTGVCLGTFGGGWHAMKMANGGKLPDFGFKPVNKENKQDEQNEKKARTQSPDQPGSADKEGK